MLDIRALRQDGEAIAEALKKRGYELDLEAFRALDARRKDADVRSQDLQAQRKKASKEVGELIKSGMDVEAAKAKVAETLKEIDDQLDGEVERAKAIQEEIRDFPMGVPNMSYIDAPTAYGTTNSRYDYYNQAAYVDSKARGHARTPRVARTH